MKKFLTLFVFLLVSPLLAGEYTITTNAVQDTRLERQRLRLNKATCASVGLGPSCSQGAARAINPDANIFGTIQEVIDKAIVTPYTQSLKNVDTSDDAEQAKALWNAKTPAQKDATCLEVGLPSGCEIWPR